MAQSDLIASRGMTSCLGLLRSALIALLTLSATAVGKAADLADVSSVRSLLDQTSLVVGRGSTATQLADGRWLVTGGEDQSGAVVGTAQLFDPALRRFAALAALLKTPRTRHAAVANTDGHVWIFGGVDARGQPVIGVERFRTDSGAFEAIGDLSLLARSGHTATLLMDGRVLLAGGVGSNGQPIHEVEVFDPLTLTVDSFIVRLNTARFDHLAALLPSDYVLIFGGWDRDGKPIADGELYDRLARRFVPIAQAPASAMPVEPLAKAAPQVNASLPADGARDVPIDVRIALRFSKPMRMDTVHKGTVALIGPAGSVDAVIVGAEGGMLAFITPKQQLLPAANYNVVASGVQDRSNHSVALFAATFTTQALAPEQGPGSPAGQPGPAASEPARPEKPDQPGEAVGTEEDDEDWIPAGHNYKGEWISHRGERAFDNPPRRRAARAAVYGRDDQALRQQAGFTVDAFKVDGLSLDGTAQAAAGVTALAGQILRINGRPLANVTVRIGVISTTTDMNGEFLLTDIPAGAQVLVIDGASANSRRRTYGRHEYRLDIEAGKTNALPFVSWMPKLDTRHAVKIPSPTTRAITVTNPKLPGLELRIPAGTVIRDANGKIVTEVLITPVPVDQTPFPMPYLGVPIYFTIQPGGAVIQGVDGKPRAATLHYPNYTLNAPGTVMDLFDYDPRGRGWYLYSKAVVSKDGKRLDSVGRDFAIYQFTATSAAYSGGPTPDNPDPPPPPCRDGNPVNCQTGRWTYQTTDLSVPDTTPLAVTRSYLSNDTSGGVPVVRAFGVGTFHPYEGYLATNPAANRIDVILTDGRSIPFPAASGTSCCILGYAALFEHTATPGEFYKATLTRTGNEIVLTFRDGRKWGYNYYGGARLQWMQDRNGNRVTLTRQSGTSGNVVRATSVNSRFIEFTYDTSNRVSSIRDNAGRTASYTYDANDRLSRVTDPENFTTEYTYDSAHRVLTVRDGRGNLKLTQEYYPTGDPNAGKVKKQTYADATTKQFAYVLNATNRVIQTDVTDERGSVKRYAFNDQSIVTSVTEAFGTPRAQTTTHEIDAATNRVTASTDALNRRSEYQYDALGNVTRVTRLAGTAQAESWNYTYDPVLTNFVKTITDPLSRTTTFTYDANANLTEIRNHLGHRTTMTYDASGRLLTSTRSPNGTTPLTITYTYDGADLVSIADALNRTTSFFNDRIGRTIAVTDPLGNMTRTEYDGRNLVRRVTDPTNQTVEMIYDGNANLTGFRDAKNNLTQFTYDLRNRVASKIDALNQSESYGYDPAGNLTRITDRKGQVTGFVYDELGRRTRIGYGATVANPTAYASTIDYAFDAGSRMTQAADSANGTITRAYDGFDRLLQEAGPQGQIDYGYYASGLRQSMTASGQAPVAYTYDDANRLARIAQEADQAEFAYDQADRRTNVTLPNGLRMAYTYDGASQLTRIDFMNGSTSIGDLTYAYDAAGRRVSEGGSYARKSLPAALNEATVDANNRLTNWNGPLPHDANGNIASIGSDTYVWNERDQLVQISGATNATFSYDAFNRRVAKAVNGESSTFLHDGWQIVRETQGANGIRYLTGLELDEVYRRTDSNGSYDYLADALGSVLALADSSRALTTNYAYEPYGATNSSGSTSANAFQYTGRENDATGLYYYRNRYYHPAISRFVQSDPIGLAGGVNTYLYSKAAPTMYTDPLGLSPTGGGSSSGSSGQCNDCQQTYFDCLANCIRAYDPLNDESKIGLTALGGTFPKSWAGLPRGLGGASPVTTVPSAVAHGLGGGGASTIGGAARTVGRAASPLWIGYGVYLFGMEGYCLASCANNQCGH